MTKARRLDIITEMLESLARLSESKVCNVQFIIAGWIKKSYSSALFNHVASRKELESIINNDELFKSLSFSVKEGTEANLANLGFTNSANSVFAKKYSFEQKMEIIENWKSQRMINSKNSIKYNIDEKTKQKKHESPLAQKYLELKSELSHFKRLTLELNISSAKSNSLDDRISELLISYESFITLNITQLKVEIEDFEIDDKKLDIQLCERIQIEISDAILKYNSEKDWFLAKNTKGFGILSITYDGRKHVQKQIDIRYKHLQTLIKKYNEQVQIRIKIEGDKHRCI